MVYERLKNDRKGCYVSIATISFFNRYHFQRKLLIHISKIIIFYKILIESILINLCDVRDRVMMRLKFNVTVLNILFK